MTPFRRSSATALTVLLLGACALLPATAPAATVPCEPGTFSPGLDDEVFPTIHELRAIDLPALTHDYAPPCLVAETAAAQVKFGVARAVRRRGDDFSFAEHAPKRIRPMGARWTAGRYRVRYRVLRCDCDPYVAVTARRGAKRIKFKLGTR